MEDDQERATALAEHNAVQAAILACPHFASERERAYAVAWATYQYLPILHPASAARYAPDPRAFGLRQRREVEHARDLFEDAVATVIARQREEAAR